MRLRADASELKISKSTAYDWKKAATFLVEKKEAVT